VVDGNGVGVAGVDIDFVSLAGGGNPHEQNDGTDANGNFFTTLDPGVYEIRFLPPPPPVTTLLTGVLTPVTVVGTKNLGTITLAAGVSAQGTVKNSAGLPVGNVKVDVYNAITGAKYHMQSNVTNAFGNFNVAVPTNTALRTELLTSGVLSQVLVPREIFGTVTGPTNFGTLTLQTGYHVTGTVRTEAGAPVMGADVDVTVLPGGETLFTPSDNTNSLGVFDVVVPAGTFDLDVTRPDNLVLVGVDVDGLSVSAATNLGVLTMRNGVFLSGTVRDRHGNLVEAADVNAIEVATGQSIALGSDNTNAMGFYSVVVPTGLLDVVFSPPGPHNVLQKDRHDGVSVTGNTVLDGRLLGEPAHVAPTGKTPSPTAPTALPLGQGTPGTGGSVPFIDARRTRAGTTLRLFGGRPGAPLHLWLGFEERALAAEPAVHLVQPLARVSSILDASGHAELTLPPESASRMGRAVYAQFLVLDPEARHGAALSHVVGLSLSN
jgi:hypothetical protein